MGSGPGLLERNLGAVFDIWDTDRDGFVGEEDLAAAGRRLTDEFGITSGPRGMAVTSALRSWWEVLRADCDKDGDGRVSRAEFAAAHASGRGQPQAFYQELVSPVIEAVAQALDLDGDGFIEAADYARAFAAEGIAAEFVAAAFQGLDGDGDGKIGTAELLAAFTHLFLSQDPGDPGTAILGEA